jgi:hypothetical protein
MWMMLWSERRVMGAKDEIVKRRVWAVEGDVCISFQRVLYTA